MNFEVLVEIDAGKQTIIAAHATKADIGGKSHIDPKRSKQREYQLTGYTCEAAVWIKLGPGFLAWDIQRCSKNANPFQGDGGADLHNTDIKGSLIRSNLPRNQHHLYVREPELKAEEFILCLCEPGYTKVWIMGKATKTQVQQANKQGDRYDIVASNLMPIP